MDRPANAVSNFLRAQATEIQASYKTTEEFQLAFGDFIEDLAIEIGEMLGTVTSSPVTVFGMFVGTLAAAHAYAMEERGHGAAEQDAEQNDAGAQLVAN